MGLLGWLIGAVLLAVPLWKLLPRAGMHPALALLAFVPLAGIVLLWVLAFKSWPGDDAAGRF